MVNIIFILLFSMSIACQQVHLHITFVPEKEAGYLSFILV